MPGSRGPHNGKAVRDSANVSENIIHDVLTDLGSSYSMFEGPPVFPSRTILRLGHQDRETRREGRCGMSKSKWKVEKANTGFCWECRCVLRRVVCQTPLDTLGRGGASALPWRSVVVKRISNETRTYFFVPCDIHFGIIFSPGNLNWKRANILVKPKLIIQREKHFFFKLQLRVFLFCVLPRINTLDFNSSLITFIFLTRSPHKSNQNVIF